jgi:hypothetical protein
MATKSTTPKQSRKPTESKATESPEELVIDFDSNWKYLIVKYFFQFIQFFIPDLYADIDLMRPPVFLDNELQTIWRSMKTGLKMTDKLVQVWLKNGEERLLLVHIEVQARFETLFSKRMYTISYRILDKYKVQPVALAVFVDTPIPSQFDTYEDKTYGTETRYKYNAYKIINQTETELLKRDDNLFSLVVLADLRTIQTKKEGEEFDRLTFKKHLYNLLLERNFDPEVYTDVLNFINYLMILPEPLEIEYKQFSIKTTKNDVQMLKRKSAPSTIALADALAMDAYGIDIPKAKRQIQVAKRKYRLVEAKVKETEAKVKETEAKVKETEAKAKETEAKAKETEAKAKETEAKANTRISKLVLALRFSHTAEQIAAIADISLDDVNAIFKTHPSENN